MTERATVQTVNDSEVTVALRSLACGGCSACGVFSSKQPQLLRASNPRGIALSPGDRVEVGYPSGRAIGAGFVVLILPLVLFIAGFSAAGAFGVTSEPLKVLAGFAGLGLGFGAAWLRGRSPAALPVITRVVRLETPAEDEACFLAGSPQ